MSQNWGSAGSGPLRMGARAPTHNHFSNARDDDPMGTMHSAAELRGSAAVSDLKNFFGQPVKGRQLDFSDAKYEQENEDYPEAFNQMWGGGDNGATFANNYLKSVLIEKAKASETWQLTIMAPWKASGPNDGLTYTWSQIRFNSHMLDREPEEAVPRLLSHTRTSGSAGLIRYGIALLLEANFAATQMGVQMYLANLEQIRIATVETCSYGAAIAVLHSKPWEDTYSAPYRTEGQTNTMSALNRMFKDECAMWAIVQKDPNGYGVVATKLKKTLQSRPDGKSGNFTVVPNGMAAYLQTSQDKAFYQNGLGDTRRISALSLGSETVVDSRPFNMGEHTTPHDPWWTSQACGDTMTMDDSTLRGVSAADYRTDMMSIMGYNGETDCAEHMFHYRDHYKAVGAWQFAEAHAPLSLGLGQGYMYDYGCYTWGQMVDRYASNPERLVDAIYLLQGEKRAEFLGTLRVLPRGDERAEVDNCAQRFDRRQFEGMLTADFAWQTFGVAERAEHKRKADAGLWGDEAGAEMERVDQERDSGKRQKRLDTRSAQDKYDEYEHKESDTSDDVDMYDDDVQAGLVTRKLRQTRAYQPEPAAIEPASPLLRLARDILRQLVAPDCVDAAGVIKTGGYTAVTIATIVQLVVDIKGATAEQRISLLGELQRVATNELMRSTKATRPSEVFLRLATDDPTFAGELDTAIIVNFIPLLASVQTRFALSQIGQDQTPLERAMLARGDQTDLTDVDDAVAKAGQWNPSYRSGAVTQHEDGQVRLVLDGVCNEFTSARLAHDAYATTLAAQNDVLFAINTAGLSPALAGMNAFVSPGAKQARTDALVWSVMLSLVASGLVRQHAAVPVAVPAGSVAPPPIAAIPVPGDTLIRLVRAHRSRATVNLLPCQEHLSAPITKAHTALVAIVKAKEFHTGAATTKGPLSSAVALQLAAVVANGYKVQPVPVVPPTAISAEVKVVCQTGNAADLSAAVSMALAVFDGKSSSTWKQNWATFRRDQIAVFKAVLAPGKVALDTQILEAQYTMLLAHYTAKDQKRPVAAASPLEPVLIGDAGAPFAWTRANLKALLYRASVVCGNFHRFSVENDIPVCFALRTWRNAMTYNMACMLRMQAGRDGNGAARTIYKDPNFMMGDNVAQKMIYGHFTMYSQTIVFRRDWIAIAKNIFSNGYIGGAGVSLWDPLNSAHINQMADNPTAHDMFVVQVPMTDAHGENAGQTWRSMTGEAPASLGATPEVNQVLSYPGAQAVADIWGWKSSARLYGAKAQHAQLSGAEDVDAHRNVICMQAFQMRYNPVTGAYDNLTISSGHWGPNVYTGMRQVIDGHKLHFDVPTYMKIRVINATLRS